MRLRVCDTLYCLRNHCRYWVDWEAAMSLRYHVRYYEEKFSALV